MDQLSQVRLLAPECARVAPIISPRRFAAAQNYSALRGHYDFASVERTMLPLEITRKLRHQSPLFPLHFPPRRFNFSLSFVSQFYSGERKMKRLFMN